jgi:hypothetical protein
MKLTRRSLLQAGALGAAAAAPSARALADDQPALVIYDSRSPQSTAFARRHRAEKIDIAAEDENLWRNLRTAAPTGRVIGLTSWDQLVIVRGYMEEQGKRLTSEVATGRLFRWDMG